MKSSITRKITMSLSAIFLIIFLFQHLIINLLALISPDTYNSTAHFMGTNFLVQFVLQPVLITGIIFHFIMGFYLEYNNTSARKTKYLAPQGDKVETWVSRNMLFTGILILLFLVIHFIQFWVPEIEYKYIDQLESDPNRYYEELKHQFTSLSTVILNVIAYLFLSLHLMHGFSSAPQSIGISNKRFYFKTIGIIYSIVVPLGYALIAVYFFYLNS